jgi:nitrite reductase (NADH) small subunit
MTALHQTPGTALWTGVCRYDELLCERGVAVLMPDGRQLALFRLADGTVHAVGQRDPYSGANVMSRGLVGTRGERPVVASPMYKQHFDLRTGEAVDDPDIRLPVHPVRVRDGVVEVGSWP